MIWERSHYKHIIRILIIYNELKTVLMDNIMNPKN